MNVQLKYDQMDSVRPDQNDKDIIELQEMQTRLDQLFNLYQSRRNEMGTISEKYLQLQRKIRIKLRKQQILSKKYYQPEKKNERA